MRNRLFFLAVVLCFASFPFFSQTHTSVPLDDQIYFLLENARARGLCRPLPSAKPYSRAVVIRAIDEILASEDSSALGDGERAILEGAKKKYSPPDVGLNWKRGEFYYERRAGANDTKYSLDVTASWQSVFSEAITAQTGGFSWGTDNWLSIDIKGDLGNSFSYDFFASGGAFSAPRPALGKYNTYYDGFQDHENYQNRLVDSFGQPTPFFPYAYRQNWDSSVFFLDKLDAAGYFYWPDSLAFGYNMLGELSGSLLDEHLTYRFGRIRREWGAGTNGQSIVFNSAARPFIALEATASPFNWLSFSALTGALEYCNTESIIESARTFQNAFSLALVEINYKNFHLDFGSSAVWPKRFELGYLFPLNSNYFYQNNVGDFDNMGVAASVGYNFPGIVRIWGALFVDEVNLTTLGSNFFKLDRNMYAFQLGASTSFPIKGLSFPTITATITKIEPYTYTHTRTYMPWYGTDSNGDPLRMETAYVNNGESLGYYLPPNSAELLVKFEAMTGERTRTRAQYQLVIHGADYGRSAVDGSSLLSELDPDGRNDKDVLKKFFLQDGAYEWTNVFKIGAEHTLTKYALPIKIFGEIGVVHTFFTNIDGPANSGSKESFSIVNDSEYTQSTRIIGTIGFCIYPR